MKEFETAYSHVIAPEDNPAEKPVEEEPVPEALPMSPEQLEEYRLEGQKMIDSYRRLFITFAKDVSLKFKLSSGFFIDFEKGEIHMDVKWFAERNLSPDQIVWATLHELSHFLDLMDDPKGLLGNFEYIKQKTKATAEKIIQKYIDAGAIDDLTLAHVTKRPPSKDGKEQLTPVEQKIYKIHHTFYNCLDDVYVNNIVSRKAPKFEEKRKGGKEVKRLYKEKLFASNDYTDFPRHLQLSYYILRQEMIRDEEIIVGDEVKEVLARKIDFEGKKYTIIEIVEQFLKPKTSRDTKATRRSKVIQKTLQPIFDELLQKDLDEWDPSKSDEDEETSSSEGENEEGEGDSQESQESEVDQGEGEATPKKTKKKKGKKSQGGGIEDFEPNPFEQDYEDFTDNNPDKIDEGEMEKWVKQEQKQKEEREVAEQQERMTKEMVEKKKAEAIQRELDKQWAEDNNVDLRALEEFRRLEQQVAPYLEELSVLWRDIVLGSSREIGHEREGYFTTGELSIPRAIEEWPQIEKRQLDDVRVMERIVEKENLVQKPELIRVRVVGDMSGSMFGPNETDHNSLKLRILRQTVTLILSSLKEFNMYLNMNRSTTKSKLEVDTEAWVFGSEPKKIKRFRNDLGDVNEQAEIVGILPELRTDLGSTGDNFALEQIHDSLTPEDIEKIAKGKIMDIVFEITDGVSDSPVSTKAEINRLDDLGVIVRGFQIGNVNESQKEAFGRIWNTSDRKRGEVVGADIVNLIPAVTEALKKYLKNVRV